MARAFVPNANFTRTFFTPGGITGRWLRREADRVAHVSKGYVGKGGSGKLAKSIKRTKVTNDGPTDLEVSVRADARKRGQPESYALVHHEGSKPHVIEPTTPGGVLHWGGRGGPHVIIVHHPGSDGTHYLVKGLNIVAGGWRG